MEDCSPKTPRVDLMWRGTGEHKRPGTQEVNVNYSYMALHPLVFRAEIFIHKQLSNDDYCQSPMIWMIQLDLT